MNDDEVPAVVGGVSPAPVVVVFLFDDLDKKRFIDMTNSAVTKLERNYIVSPIRDCLFQMIFVCFIWGFKISQKKKGGRTMNHIEYKVHDQCNGMITRIKHGSIDSATIE